MRYGKGCPQCQTHLEKNRCTVCGTVWAANDVSVEVYPGEVLGIVGESGSGKSTLMQSLYFDIAPTSGEAYLQDYKDGKESIWLASAAEQRHIKNCIMGMVYQNPVRGLRMQYSAASNIAEKLIAAGNRSAGHMTERAKELLQAVEILTSRMGEAPKNFSGGMQQRVQISKALANNPSLLLLDEVTTGLDLSCLLYTSIARAIMQEPKLILCDEPIASLDPKASKTIMDHLAQINQTRKITCIVNLHQVDVAMKYSQRILGIAAGKLVFDGTPSELTQEKIHEIYQSNAQDLMLDMQGEAV